MGWYHEVYLKTVSLFDQMRSVNQDLTVKVDLTTSIADIMASRQAFVSELNRGFAAEFQLELIA